MLVDDIRSAAAWVAGQATHVRIDEERIPAYAATLPVPAQLPGLDPDVHVLTGPLEQRAAFTLALDAINFGSGWFPTLRKRDGRSGYFTVALGLRERFDAQPWTAADLRAVDASDVAAILRQDPDHELMSLFAAALNDLGAHVEQEHGDRFEDVVAQAGNRAVALVETLATWECFADSSTYAGRPVPFFKRAQIAAADLTLAGAAAFPDLDRLTLFADNLVPHVLRLDGILRFDPAFQARIDANRLIEHGEPAEVEMRAAAIHVAELIVGERPDLTAQQVDQILWNAGGGARYKALPRPRARSTAY